MIVDYSVVTAGGADEMSRRVKEKMDDGWQPYGSLAATATYLHQPMVTKHFEFDFSGSVVPPSGFGGDGATA